MFEPRNNLLKYKNTFFHGRHIKCGEEWGVVWEGNGGADPPGHSLGALDPPGGPKSRFFWFLGSGGGGPILGLPYGPAREAPILLSCYYLSEDPSLTTCFFPGCDGMGGWDTQDACRRRQGLG